MSPFDGGSKDLDSAADSQALAPIGLRRRTRRPVYETVAV